MEAHRGRGSSGLSPSSLPTSIAPPSCSEARTELSWDRAASPAAVHRHPTLTGRRSRWRAPPTPTQAVLLARIEAPCDGEREGVLGFPSELPSDELELAGARGSPPLCPLSLTAGTHLSVPRVGGSPSGPRARRGPRPFPGRPSIKGDLFLFYLSLLQNLIKFGKCRFRVLLAQKL
jgi:hypothetical protein